MADENEADTLSADEQAYFESRGEKEVPVTPPVADEAKVADAKPEGSSEDDGDKPVPLRALTREKEKVRALRAEAEKERTQRAVLEDRWNMVLQRFNQQEETPPAAPPNPDEDIFGAIKHALGEINGVKTQLTQRQQQEQQAEQAQQIEAAIWNVWEDDARGFASQQKDFPDAAKWLAEFRDKQLSALSTLDARFGNKAARDAQMNAELREMVINARRANISPAEAVYNLAKSWGYQGKQAEATGADIEKLAKAIEGETSLSQAGGSAPKANKTLQDVADMSGDEFEAWLSKAGEKGFKRMMAGA